VLLVEKQIVSDSLLKSPHTPTCYTRCPFELERRQGCHEPARLRKSHELVARTLIQDASIAERNRANFVVHHEGVCRVVHVNWMLVVPSCGSFCPTLPYFFFRSKHKKHGEKHFLVRLLLEVDRLALVISVVSGDWKVLLRKEVRLVRTIE
jgi:hypothetical protein